ncbi:MAG: hypothetical protein COB02_18540 [Candidatus Cloacimonadota bacterium]|nr:MAG: hypothetical protein COB02_18540 [Candidatus Cloacimonadota bacterium]
MKVLIVLFYCFLSSSHAKWRPYNLKELIQHSDFISIAEFVTEIKSTKTKRGTNQVVEFKNIKTIKGSKNISSFLVLGRKTQICVSQILFPNKAKDKYLLFLSKSKNSKFRVINGNLGALLIKNKQLTWFKNPNHSSFQREKKSLSKALSDIEKNQ